MSILCGRYSPTKCNITPHSIVPYRDLTWICFGLYHKYPTVWHVFPRRNLWGDSAGYTSMSNKIILNKHWIAFQYSNCIEMYYECLVLAVYLYEINWAISSYHIIYIYISTHLNSLRRVTHICVSKLDHHWSRWCIDPCSVQNVYPSQ